MADKADVLSRELPAFVERMIAPRCYADGSTAPCSSDADCAGLGANATCDASSGLATCFVPSNVGACPAGTRAEFPPVRDLHVAVVTSSLGSGGAPDACADRGGRLFDAGFASAAPRDGSGGGFLAWLPRSVPDNVEKPAPNVTAYGDGEDARFVADFGTLVSDAGASGCGLEGQLESWYRFLIQPDPYASIASTNDDPPRATLVGVDATVLKMRHDFLRPDSLLIIVQVTDEDDAWSDPLAENGHGWFSRTANFPGGPGGGLGPRGTSACDADPTSPACGTCADPANATDPNCSSCAGGVASCPKKGWYAPGQDGLDVRYTDDMKRRYGFDPQWDVERYVDGVRSMTVPDRDHEGHDDWTKTIRNCGNPLYAQALPDGTDTSHAALCDLAPGPRTPDLVEYVLLGGVAPSLIERPLTAADWTKLVGSPRDPHMVESIAPRAGLPVPGASYDLGSDPDVGREWNTTNATGVGDEGSSVDLQLACTFALAAPRDCTTTSPCPCAPGSAGATANDGPPLCDPSARTTQVRAAAYPSIRELRVAKGLGAQAFVGSICAPFGPVETAALSRLAVTPDEQCFPEKLEPAADCSVSCVALVGFPNETEQSAGCKGPGMSQPDAPTLARFAARYQESFGDAGDAPVPVVCVYRQLVGGASSTLARNGECTGTSGDYVGPTCAGSAESGWCYADGAEFNGGCPTGIDFGGGGPPVGTTVTLDCLEPSE